MFQKFSQRCHLHIKHSELECSNYAPWDNEIYTGLVSSRVSYTSWGEGASLALAGHPTTDGITIKILYRVDVLLHQQPAFHPFFSYWLVKTKSDFIVRSVETGLGRWTLVVVVVSVDAYPFLAFSDLTCGVEDTGKDVFWLHCAAW